MKKTIVVSLAIFTLLAVQAQAQDDGYYIGLDIGNTEGRVTQNIPAIGSSSSSTNDGGSQTLKVGKYFDNNSRAAVFYQNASGADSTVGYFGIGYDYLFGDGPLKPFVGVMLGYGKDSKNNYHEVVSGLVYGIQAGVNYELNTNFSLEAGYRIMASNMKVSQAETVSTYAHDIKIENIKNWYVGVNYKF